MRQISFLNRKFNVEVFSDADESVIREIFEDREYLNLEPLIRTSRNSIIDIGAHKGFFVLYARVLNPYVPIYAFEPEERNFQEMKKTLLRNEIRDVFPKNSAVADKEGVADLFISEDSHNHSLITFAGSRKRVNVTTLEKILNKIGKCDVVKMDCEGLEFKIIANLPDKVFEKIPVFFIEYHEYAEDMRNSDLKVKLEKNGYKVKVYPSRHDEKMGYVIGIAT